MPTVRSMLCTTFDDVSTCPSHVYAPLLPAFAVVVLRYAALVLARGENNEVDQTRPALEGVLMDGTVNHMRYKLPEITCDHAILMMRYREYGVASISKSYICGDTLTDNDI